MTLTKLWTTAGLQKQINCLLNGDNFGIKYIAVGDGAGVMTSPAVSDTALVNEVWRGEISEIKDNSPQFTAIAYIPEDEGDFIMRELGIFDEDGELLFIAQMDETPKYSTDTTGLIKEIGLKVVFELQNGLSAVTVDRSAVTATCDYVDEALSTTIADYQLIAEKGIAGGYAPVDETGKIPADYLPDTSSIYNVFCVNTGDVTEEGEPAWLDIDRYLTIESEYSSEGISDFNLKTTVYFDNVTDYGDYTFTYDGSAWSLSYDAGTDDETTEDESTETDDETTDDETTETEDSETASVDLSDYGISFTEKFSTSASYVSSTITGVSLDYDQLLNATGGAGTYYFIANYDAGASSSAAAAYTSETLTAVTVDNSYYSDYTEDTELTFTYQALTLDMYEDETGSDEADVTFEDETGADAEEDDLIYVTDENGNQIYSWHHDGTEIDLSDYGITIEGEPAEGDIITVTVTAGQDGVTYWVSSGNTVSLDDYGITYEGEAADNDMIIVTVTSLLTAGDTITVTVYSPEDETITQIYTLETSGTFYVTTADGTGYEVADTLTLDISNLEDGFYNVYVDPVNLTLSVIDNTIISGISFPSDVSTGDYLLNTSQVPYDLQEYSDEIQTGLTQVFAGVLTIIDGVKTLNPARYNVNSIITAPAESRIGEPVITVNSVLADNEIWLEGAEVAISSYPQLYKIYGDTYGTASADGYFILPDFRDRALWGGDTFGYLDAGLPDISGTFRCLGGGTGAFTASSKYSTKIRGASGSYTFYTMSFNASSGSSAYGTSDTVQPPAIVVRVKTRYI